MTDTARAVGERYGVATLSALGDLTVSGDVARVVNTVTANLGPIDILVHNAGGDIAAAGGKPDPNDAIMVKEVDVRAVLDRNLLSTILVCQSVARGMMQRRAGRIITVSSIAAYGGRASGAIYATAKAAAIHYTRCLAAQLRPFNVTANSIAPGDTRTGRFLNTRYVDPARLVEGDTLERIALVDEVARAVAVFAGPPEISSPGRCCGSTAASNVGQPDRCGSRQGPGGFPDRLVGPGQVGSVCKQARSTWITRLRHRTTRIDALPGGYCATGPIAWGHCPGRSPASRNRSSAAQTASTARAAR